MKRLSSLFIVAVLVCGLSFIGCKKQEADTQEPAVTEEGAQPAEAPAQAPAEEKK